MWYKVWDERGSYALYVCGSVEKQISKPQILKKGL